MPHFAVQYTYVDDAAALDAVRPTHRDFLRSLTTGPLLAAGPLVGSPLPGALLIVTAESPEAVGQLLDEDPFWTENLIVERTVEEWNPVIGVFAS
ncbi:MAG: YciI family protein [Arachnia sp.]